MLKLILIKIIRAYQSHLSPYLGQSCRFYPSCSQYTLEAIECHGALRGLRYGLTRVARCHPWNAGGYDPVGETRDEGRSLVPLDKLGGLART